jgi:DNA polymerase-3 subunit epsilon
MLDLTIARLRNRWTRTRLRNRKLDSAARSNLKALDHLNPLRPAKSYRYVVVDVETTGLNLRHDRMVSIAAVRILDCRILLGQVFYEMVNPGREIPSDAIKLHGIFPGLVAEARTDEEVFSDFLEFIGDDILVAHHAGFDLNFLNRTMKGRYGFGLQNLTLDTEKLFREIVILPLLLPYRAARFQSSYSLDAIANHFDIEIQDRHTAMGDALATAMIFQRILTKLNRGLDPVHRLVRAGYRF